MLGKILLKIVLYNIVDSYTQEALLPLCYLALFEQEDHDRLVIGLIRRVAKTYT